MADEKLVEEVAQSLGRHDDWSRNIEGYTTMARSVLLDKDFIKRMAEGVGFEVKEKPLRYTIDENEWAVYLHDVSTGQYAIRIDKKLGAEMALRWCQERADSLNQKERG